MAKFKVTLSVVVEVHDNFRPGNPGGPTKPENIINTAVGYATSGVKRAFEEGPGVLSAKLSSPKVEQILG
jgi:hypothetical protein